MTECGCQTCTTFMLGVRAGLERAAAHFRPLLKDLKP